MNPAYKGLAYAIGLGVVSYGVVFAHFGMIDRFNAEAAERSVQMATARADREAAMSLVEKLKDAGGLPAILRAAYVPKDDLVPFIESLESRARSGGLAPEVISANDNAGTAERPMLSATVQVTGDRTAVDGYVRSLETLPYHVVVESIGVSRADAGRWKGTVAVSAFVLPEALAREAAANVPKR